MVVGQHHDDVLQCTIVFVLNLRLTDVNVANDVTNTSVSQAVNASAYLFQDTYKRMEKLVVRRSQDALM